VVRLTTAYQQTQDAVAEGKTANAAAIFAKDFDPLTKSLVRIMPQTYPPRFRRIGDWCAWIEGLSKKSGETLAALRKGDEREVALGLDGLRAHFFNLHRETQLINKSDLIYLFWKSAWGEKPAAESLQQVITLLETAPHSRSTGARGAQFDNLRKTWLAQVEPILKDGNVGPDEIATLRNATDVFYRRFGRDFE